MTSDPRLPDFDTGVAHNARVWNYWLGGKDNYAVDRAVGDPVTGLFPDRRRGPGGPRVPRPRGPSPGRRGGRAAVPGHRHRPADRENTHEVAQRIAPDARIVYVDNDPIVLAHARALLTSSPQGATAYIDADVHDPTTSSPAPDRRSTSAARSR